ncbi:MAG: alpha/beta fold hydrolase [Synergistaceae bacterium]|nr:alpha/beta fold hydrolase [Synergistaceae bacterium]
MHKVYLGRDSPVADAEHPPFFAGFSCPSEGCSIFGAVYYAEGLGNPAAVFCHGLPGLDKNGDVAQVLRCAGFNSIVFSYRGTWGSSGSFAFSGIAADVASVVGLVRRRRLLMPERFDGRVVLIGHSTGGFAAIKAALSLPEVRDIVLLSVWNVGVDGALVRRDAATRARVEEILRSAACFYHGTTSGALFSEITRNAEAFDLRNDAAGLCGRRVLMVCGDGDASVPVEVHQKPLAETLRKAGCDVTERSIKNCDHGFSAKRNALMRTVLRWLAEGGY